MPSRLHRAVQSRCQDRPRRAISFDATATPTAAAFKQASPHGDDPPHEANAIIAGAEETLAVRRSRWPAGDSQTAADLLSKSAHPFLLNKRRFSIRTSAAARIALQRRG